MGLDIGLLCGGCIVGYGLLGGWSVGYGLICGVGYWGLFNKSVCLSNILAKRCSILSLFWVRVFVDVSVCCFNFNRLKTSRYTSLHLLESPIFKILILCTVDKLYHYNKTYYLL